MKSNRIVDAKGLACPMPIVKTKKAINELQTGEILEVHATDKGSRNDMAAWVKTTGNEMVQEQEENGVFKFWIKKGSH